MPDGKRLLWALAGLVLGALVLRNTGAALDPYTVTTDVRYIPPSLTHPFGTDGLGRSMLARTLFAAGLSLQVVLGSLALSFVLALVLGGIAGLTAGQWPDLVISWVIALLYTLPLVLLVVAVLAVWGTGIERAFLIIGAVGWTAPARLVRAEVLRLRAAPHVIAQRAFGFSEAHVLFRSVLPAAVVPAALTLLFYVPELISIEVGLSFFGLGAPPPTPTLGRLIYDGLSEFYTGWWLATIPATALLGLITAFHSLAHLLNRDGRITPQTRSSSATRA